MKNSFSVSCACGYKNVFPSDAKAGVTIWLQCESCGEVFRVGMPGEYAGRATRDNTGKIRDAIFDAFADNKPRMTVRQVFYALAVQRIVEKSQKGYRQVQTQLTAMRRAGILPYSWLADNTRWQIAPKTYTGIVSAMEIFHDAYRRDLWESQNMHVEVWIEKDALAGVVSPITASYGVPLYVARGYSSVTFAYDAAEAIMQIDKPTYIYHFGDFDPSGVNAAESIERELEKHGAAVHFQRVGVTLEQIKQYELPTIPKVNRKDPRAKNWKHNFVCELDALPAATLRQLVQDCITRHINADAWRRVKQAEELEKDSLASVMPYLVQEQNNILSTLSHTQL